MDLSEKTYLVVVFCTTQGDFLEKLYPVQRNREKSFLKTVVTGYQMKIKVQLMKNQQKQNKAILQ